VKFYTSKNWIPKVSPFFFGLKTQQNLWGKKTTCYLLQLLGLGKRKLDTYLLLLVSNKPQKKILSVVYIRNKDEPKTWQTLLTKDTHQERGSGGETKVAKHTGACNLSITTIYTHSCIIFHSPTQPNGLKVLHNPNKKITI
jgi:hypothetical protein